MDAAVMRGGLLPEALRRRLFCAIMEKTGSGVQDDRYRTAPEKPVPKQEELNVKNTFHIGFVPLPRQAKRQSASPTGTKK